MSTLPNQNIEERSEKELDAYLRGIIEERYRVTETDRVLPLNNVSSPFTLKRSIDEASSIPVDDGAFNIVKLPTNQVEYSGQESTSSFKTFGSSWSSLGAGNVVQSSQTSSTKRKEVNKHNRSSASKVSEVKYSGAGDTREPAKSFLALDPGSSWATLGSPSNEDRKEQSTDAPKRKARRTIEEFIELNSTWSSLKPR